MDKGNSVKGKNKSDSILDPFLLLEPLYSVAFARRIVAYSLKHIGEPILQALTFKGITLFHSYSDKKLQDREERLSCWRVYRNILTWPTWTAARTKDSCTKKFATISHTPAPFSRKEAWILSWGRWFFWDTSPLSSLSLSLIHISEPTRPY